MPESDAGREPRPQERADAAASENPDAGEFARQFAAAAEKSGLGALARDERLTGRDLLSAVGGIRGILEALLPGLVFLVVYSSLTSFAGWEPQAALVPALAASVGLAVVFTIVRIVTKGQTTQAIAGLIGVLASAALALWTGNARDNYVLGFFTNAGYALALLVSLLVRWPALGLIVGFLMGEGLAWRDDRRKYRAAQFLTLVWIGLFVARLVVQVPLYLVDNVESLGATRLLMGVPLYALVLVFTWLVVRAVYPSSRRAAE
jgi:ABC-type glycerol-3-phosphate transport system permease component